MPQLTEVRVYDNSREADLYAGVAPEPRLILHVARGKIVRMCDLASTPTWAKPLVLTALKATRGT